MSEEKTTEQAVAEKTEGPVSPAPEESSAQGQEDNLEELLSEFEQGTKPAQQPEETAAPTQKIDVNVVAQLESRLKAIESSHVAERDTKDINSLVDKVAKDSPLSRRIVAGTLNQLAIEDPAIGEAFKQRVNNPKAWEAAQRRLMNRYAEEMKGLPDTELSENREAMTAAVQRGSKKPPETPEIDESEVRGMNDAQFEAWVRSQAKKSA